MYRGPPVPGNLTYSGGHPDAEPKRPPLGSRRTGRALQGITQQWMRSGLERQTTRVWLALGTLLVCGGIAIFGLTDVSYVYRAFLPEARAQYMDELDLLIKQAEQERADILVKLRDDYREYTRHKDAIDDKAQRRKEEQAEYDRIQEVYRGSMQDVQPDLRHEYETELNASRAALDQAVGEHNYAAWSVRVMAGKFQYARNNLVAFSALIADMKALRSGGRASGKLRGHPAKLLTTSYMKPSGAAFDKKRLKDMYLAVQWEPHPEGYISEEEQREIEAFVEEATTGLDMELGKIQGGSALHAEPEEGAATGVSSEGRGKAGEEEEEAENPDFTFRRTLKGNVRWLDAAGDNGPGGTGAKAAGGGRPSAEESTSATAILAGTRQGAGALLAQDAPPGQARSGIDSEAARHQSRRQQAAAQASAQLATAAAGRREEGTPSYAGAGGGNAALAEEVGRAAAAEEGARRARAAAAEGQNRPARLVALGQEHILGEGGAKAAMRAFSGALSRRPQDGGMAGAALSKPLQPAQKGERQGSALAGSQSAAQLAAAVAGSKASQQERAVDAARQAAAATHPQGQQQQQASQWQSVEAARQAAHRQQTGEGAAALLLPRQQRVAAAGSGLDAGVGLPRLPDQALNASAAAKQGVRGKDRGGAGAAGGRGSEAAGSQGDEPDDSVRCRMAGICEGPGACQPGDEMGCMTSAVERQQKVKEMMQWSWKGYRQYAWGQDELQPLTRTSGTWFNLGLTLVDSLDTLLIMGMRDEFLEARDWVEGALGMDPNKAVNLFETTIRVLGGLLAAFHLSAGDQMFLFKAADLGARLAAAFGSDTGIPFSDVNLRTHELSQPPWTQYSSLSEVATLCLEFTYLERAAGEAAGGARSLAVMETLMGHAGRIEGLAPFFVDPKTGALSGGIMTLGARGDSYYEYLLKQWLLGGKRQASLLRGYKEAMGGVRHRLLARTAPAAQGGLLYVGELHGEALQPKMDHLVCFLPGLLALGHLHGVNTAPNPKADPDDLALARDLMRTCYELYARSPTGLAPEIAHFTQREGGDAAWPKRHAQDVGGGDFTIKPQDAHNLLRPETMESLFVLWRATRDARYRDWGWQMLRAWERFCRVGTGGYASLNSVLQIPVEPRDKMESFWPAETLKYAYLLLDTSTPELLPLDQFVFNTEAHPLPILDTAADAAAARAYVRGPRGDERAAGRGAGVGAPLTHEALDERAKAWAGALAAMGNANAFALNGSWSPAVSAAREAALRAALTG